MSKTERKTAIPVREIREPKIAVETRAYCEDVYGNPHWSKVLYNEGGVVSARGIPSEVAENLSADLLDLVAQTGQCRFAAVYALCDDGTIATLFAQNITPKERKIQWPKKEEEVTE